MKTPISTDLPYTPAEATCQNYTLLSTIMVSSQEIITEQFLKLLMKYLLSTVHFYHKMNLGFGLLKLQDIWVSSDLKSFKLVRKDRVRFEQMNSKTKHIGESFSEEIWMIGIIFLKLAKGLSHDNRNLNILRLLQLISEGNQLEEISLSLAAWDLLKKLLKKRPIERISARKALLHDWLK